MTKRERKPFGQRLIAGMSEGLERLREEKPLRTSFVPVPPAPPEFRREELVELRTRLNMTQAAMAALVNVSEKTLESWEQGSRSPNGAALRLLQVIDRPAILAEVGAEKPRQAHEGRRQSVPAHHRRERILMALLLELVRAKPGLPEDRYSDALGDATRIRHHAGALSEEEHDALTELLPEVPKQLFIGKSKRSVRFPTLVKGLEQLGYLVVEKKRGARLLKPSPRDLASEHGWLSWPTPAFADLVWAVSKRDLEKKKSRQRETVEV